MFYNCIYEIGRNIYHLSINSLDNRTNAFKFTKSRYFIPIYRLLTRTTQPAHIIAVCVLTFVTFTVWPDIVDTRNASTNRVSEQVSTMGDHRSQRHNTLAAIAYLGAFATHFGAQIWMTFISGKVQKVFSEIRVLSTENL